MLRCPCDPLCWQHCLSPTALSVGGKATAVVALSPLPCSAALDQWDVPRCCLGPAPPLPGFADVKPRAQAVA